MLRLYNMKYDVEEYVSCVVVVVVVGSSTIIHDNIILTTGRDLDRTGSENSLHDIDTLLLRIGMAGQGARAEK
jgi:hypothetical protein